jgi:histidyl-tRNA synthetase
VKEEMVREKGLNSEVADRVATFVLNSGQPLQLWEKMNVDNLFGDHPIAREAMRELKVLFSYLEAMNCLDCVSFDLSLARGLDYYTGVIYEAILLDGSLQVGSIAAGGRYDNLVGMFSPSGVQTPCVGVSIGVERVFTILEKKAQASSLFHTSSIQVSLYVSRCLFPFCFMQVFVASIGDNLMLERMKVAQVLWRSNYSCEYPHAENPKFKRQLEEVLERRIPFMIILGENEIKNGVLKVKNMTAHEEVETSLENLLSTLTSMGCTPLSGSTYADIRNLSLETN